MGAHELPRLQRLRAESLGQLNERARTNISTALEGVPRMKKPGFLNARAADYWDLIGNGRVYRVPPHQRDYSWTHEEWEDLWRDVVALRDGGGEARHYLGALVVQEVRDRDFRVIDGQQRLATLSVFALAVVAHLQELAGEGRDAEANRGRSERLRSRFVGEKDPASLVESSHLFLNDADDGFYQDHLVQLRPPHNPRGLSDSNRQLWGAFQHFRGCIDRLPDRDDGASVARILSETVAKRLVFIVIDVDDESDAYTVFETMNARGVDLTTTDLLKNFLFSQVRVASDLDTLRRRWLSLVGTVGARRFPDFLRAHLLCETPGIRKRRTFRFVRSRIASSHDVFQLIDDMEPRGELFAALRDPGHEYWAELPQARPHVREFLLFGAREATPLLFAAWKAMPPTEFAKTLMCVCTVAFRYSVVCGLRNGAFESACQEAAVAIGKGDAGTARSAFEFLKAVYVDDKKFARDFAQLVLDPSRKRLTRYVLARLETDAAGRACDPETDPGTVEHILPLNPSSDWDESFPARRWDGLAHRLGNLTLLEPTINRAVGNAAYGEKVAAYARSGYALTRAVAELAPEEWTASLLDERQRRMGKRAAHLWRIDVG